MRLQGRRKIRLFLPLAPSSFQEVVKRAGRWQSQRLPWFHRCQSLLLETISICLQRWNRWIVLATRYNSRGSIILLSYHLNCQLLAHWENLHWIVWYRVVTTNQPTWKLLPRAHAKGLALTSHGPIWEGRGRDRCSCHLTSYMECLVIYKEGWQKIVKTKKIMIMMFIMQAFQW